MKTGFCLCETKDTVQQCSNYCTAYQHLCFHYTDSTIPLPLKSKISSFYPFSVFFKAGLCQTWSETPKTSFIVSQLSYKLPPILQVNPNYKAAMQALGALNRNDIEEVKSFREPPELVKYVVNALCLLFDKPQE